MIKKLDNRIQMTKCLRSREIFYLNLDCRNTSSSRVSGSDVRQRRAHAQ